jgi:hypothetical protein
MSVNCFTDLRSHVGHSINCVVYGDDDNVAIECVTCGEVLLDYDNPSTPQPSPSLHVMTDLTLPSLHHVCEYGGGPLAIRGHIYGEPGIRYLLKEHPDTFGITPSLIAWSYNREEIEALLLQLCNET